MRGVGLIDAQTDLPRIRQQPGVQQHVVGRIVAEHGAMLLIDRDRFGIVHPRLDVVGGAHRGARTQERREARKAEPGFIPEEDQVGLDRQTLLHHPAGVVDVAVEGAIGQVDHLDPMQPVVGLQVQQRLLDGLERHRAIHRIFRHREGFDIKRLRARQHHAVVMRFVAVAVDDHDIAGTDQRLHRHLVGRRRAIGDKEDLVGPKGARRLFLGLLDVAGRLEQAVETSRGRAALGEEKVRTVEFAHVADPVRPEDGLAARDGERVERSDRTLGVFLEIVEERRFEAILNTFQDGKMQLEQLFHRVEDAANDIGLGIAGQLLHVRGWKPDRRRARDECASTCAPAPTPSRTSPGVPSMPSGSATPARRAGSAAQNLR